MPRTVYLTPPRISADHIKEKITCIRAHRERIFQVTTETRGTQLICHNYGQGGAGWTFLFGCVHTSLRQFEQSRLHNPSWKNAPITVIGAGCYGLLTAILLARNGHSVRLVAENLNDLSSYKAAGFFFPRPRKISTPEECALFEAYGTESYRTYQAIINNEHPFIQHGPLQLPAYYDPAIDPGFAPYIKQGLIQEPELVTTDFGNGKAYSAMEYMTLFINSTHMMQELWRTIRELAIPITQAKVDSFDEIDTPIVFNCAGMGAQTLVPDVRVVPVQGHLITLKDQPPMSQLQYMINVRVTMATPHGRLRDELIYFAPKESGILGITFIRGQSSLTANQHEFDRLLQRCIDYFGTPILYCIVCISIL